MDDIKAAMAALDAVIAAKARELAEFAIVNGGDPDEVLVYFTQQYQQAFRTAENVRDENMAPRHP